MTIEILKNSCSLLNSDKITDRKKGAEQLKHLLNNESIISLLNHYSKTNHGNRFDWDQVFYSAKCYFIKEAEKLAKEEQKKEETSTKTNRTSWRNQKYMIPEIPKLVLQKSSKKGTAYVSCTAIIEFVMAILNRHHTYLLENFASLAIKILHNFIFRIPRYYLNVPLEKWKEIFRMCIWIYNNKIAKTDCAILLSVVEGIVKGFRTFKNEQEISPCTFFKVLPKFLCSVAEDLKNTLSYGSQTSYLSLLYTCSNMFGSQWRQAMCKVGEKTFGSVLDLWEGRQTARQILLYQYLNLQLTMHHPQKDGHYNESWEYSSSTWNNAMKHMYDKLIDMLSDISQTARHALGSTVKDIVAVPNEMLIFAARLFSKIFSCADGVFSLNVTQAGVIQTPNITFSYSTQTTKKRRIEISFEKLCEFLKEDLDVGKLPWFYILEHMLQHHSYLFTDSRKIEVLDVLYYLLSSATDSSIIDCLIRCLKNLCIIWKLKLDETAEITWKSIYDRTWRLIGGSQCVTTGAQLLRKIIELNFVQLDGNTFKIFKTNSVCNCQEGLELLQVLLQGCQMPKTLESEYFYVKREAIIDSRMQLLSYLIPIDESAASLSFSLSLSEVLLLLCANEPMQVKGQLVAIESVSDRKQASLEEIYMKSSFCTDTMSLVVHHEENKKFNYTKINRTFEEHIVHHLILYTEKRNLCVEKTVNENFKYALNICYLALYLSPFLESRRLRNLFKLQHYFADAIQKSIEDQETTKWTTTEQLLSDLVALYHKCSFIVKTCEHGNENLQYISKNIPIKVITICLDIMSCRLSYEESSKKTGNNSGLQNTCTSGHSRMSIAFESDDDLDLLEVTDMGPPKDEFESSDSPDWYLEISKDKKTSLNFSSPTLSAKDACFLKAASLICAVEQLSHLITKEKISDESNLLTVIDIFDKYAGSSELEDIALVFPFLSELFALPYQEENVDDGIAMLSKLSGKHSNDSRVAAQVLMQIKDLLINNGLNLVQSQRINLIHVTKTFARKIKNHSYGFNVLRILYQVNLELIKLDPMKEWSEYRLESDRIGTSSSDIYELLKSVHQDVRIIWATDYLASLLIRQNGEFLPIDVQLMQFEKIYQTAMESLTIEGQPNEDLLPDEENGRIIGFLMTLVNVAIASPFLEYYSVYALFSAIKTYNINKQLVKTAVSRIASAKNMDMIPFLEEHLLFIVSQWIHDKNNLSDFPFEIINLKTYRLFLERYNSVVVLSIFNQNLPGHLDSIGDVLNVSNNQMIRTNFASIFASLLPYLVLADSTTQNIPKSKCKTSVSQFKYLEANLGRELMTSLLEDNIGQVTLALLNFCHDLKSWTENELVFPPHQFYYESSIVEETLNSFHKSFFENEYIVTLLAKQQTSLHVVIHGLFTSISEANSVFKYRWALAKIEVFVKILLPHFRHGFGQMTAYVINRLTLILTAFTFRIFNSSKYLAVRCNKIFLTFLKSAVDSHPKYVAATLKTTLSRLLRFVGDDEVWRSASQILDYLMASTSREILSALALFPSFPDENDHILQEIRRKHLQIISKHEGITSLKKYVEKFLEVSKFDNNEYYLKFLLSKLKGMRSEIYELYEVSLSSGQKLSHEVIHRLINVLCLTDKKEIKQIVSDCLGQFGPTDLEVDVFDLKCFDNNNLSLIEDNTQNMHTQVILLLYRMTYSVDVKCVEAAISSLRCALNTKVGREALNNMDETINLELLPFISDAKTNSQRKHDFKDICSEDLWTVGYFEIWLITLTSNLLNAGVGCDFLHSLLDACKISASFCEEIFPFVLFYSLKCDLKNRRAALSKCVTFLIREELKKQNSDKSLQLIIKAINYLRMQEIKISFSERKNTPKWEKNFWLDLDFSDVAEAAFRIGSHFSAIFFTELSCELIENGLYSKREESYEDIERRKLSPLQRISSSEHGLEISNFLLKIYNDLGDSIGIEGCSGSNAYVSGAVQVALSRHNKNYMNAIALCDAASDTEAYADTLRDAGLYKILSSLVPPSPEKSERFLDAQAECAWRLGKWSEGNQSSGVNKLNSSSHFNHAFLMSLTELKNQNSDKVEESINLAKLVTINAIDLKESPNSLYPYLTQLKMISEFKEIADCFFSNSAIPDMDKFLSLATFYELHDPLDGMSFKFSEKILSSRISTLKVVHAYIKESYVQNVLFNSLIKKCQLCRSSKSGNAISQWKAALTDGESLDLDNVQRWRLQLETAHFFSALGSPRQSLSVLEKISHRIGFQSSHNLEEQKLLSKALTLSGKILMETRVQSPQTIVNDYFLKAIKLEEDFNGNIITAEDLESSYYQLGKYGDFLYQEIIGYLTSDQCKDRKNQIQKSKEEARKVAVLCNTKSTGQLQEEIRIQKKLILLQKEISRETSNLAQRKEEASLYLNLALQNYLKGLVSSPKANLVVFRIISLWFENLKEGAVNTMIRQYTKKIKTHQFLPLVYQLVARLTNISDGEKHHSSFPETLTSFLERICMDHPYHTLHVVMMLANSYLDEEINSQGGSSCSRTIPKKRSKNSQMVIEEDRILAAKDLICKLKNTRLSEHIKELESVCYAYVHFVNTTPKPSNQSQVMGKGYMKNQIIMKLKSLKYVAPLSRPIAIQSSSNYSPPTIMKWDNVFNYCGGINAPIRLTVQASDGLHTMELLKGNDDLRQDAVLEQVFTVMNNLLRRDFEAKKHRLSIRTYTVVPFSQMSGLIEWCNNTKSIGEIFIDLHDRFYPDKLSATKCRKKMMEVRKHRPDERFTNFKEILLNFPPAFRFFFFEHYSRPDEWFSQRQAYVRSVATSSIAGYIIGLGDRHVQNLLFDVSTAEIIHIDLGIAFENGKILPTPELIPFRLTQDIIDGFGVAGVEGPFRKYMEITLKVLRESKSVITTIVEVLKYDPLHQWTLNPSQVAKLQASQHQVTNACYSSSVSSAERALLRVQNKLNGLQEGVVLSVPEQVSKLIQQASNNHNLSQLFPGWQPYL